MIVNVRQARYSPSAVSCMSASVGRMRPLIHMPAAGSRRRKTPSNEQKDVAAGGLNCWTSTSTSTSTGQGHRVLAFPCTFSAISRTLYHRACGGPVLIDCVFGNLHYLPSYQSIGLVRAMSQNNTSSNETHMLFAAPALPSSTPGSGDSGGGGTTSWVAVSTSSHSGASTGNGHTTRRNRPQRSSSARAVRHPWRPAIEDKSDDAPTGVVTRSSGAGHTASAAKRK